MRIALFFQPYSPFSRRCVRSFLLVFFVLSYSLSRAQAPLKLPFFDDFSTTSGRPGFDQPNPIRWKPGGGVYINNTMAINQPTVNVATFDGLGANGRPYVQNTPLAQGYTDTLTSNAIDLSGIAQADINSVYMSFYWQAKGLGELPDPSVIQIAQPDTTDLLPGEVLKPYDKLLVVDGVSKKIHIDTLVVQPGDSLTLQFMGVDGTWTNVWYQMGGLSDSLFHQVLVQVKPSYFHAKFAFRFRSFGRESGPFDTWHIDYIYLNRGRSATDKTIQDVGARKQLTPFFKQYTAMPLSQYLVNPTLATADSVTTDVNNLGGLIFTTYNFTVRDDVSGQLLQNDPQTETVATLPLRPQQKTAKPTPIKSFGSATKALLRYKIDVRTADNNTVSPIPGIDFRQNDTISAVAALDNYYAYDDGSWEYAQQIRQREQVAVRFVLNKPDAIGGVKACIVPFTTNQSGQPFVISVYNSRAGKPGTAIYQQSFSTQYPTSRNEFVEFKFTKSVSVKDTFYVGYQQISSADTSLLRLGFDKNSPFGSQIFYNGGSNWDQNLASASLNIQGAFMLRPVMGAKPDTIVTAIPEPEPLAPLQTYPNPTTGLIRWGNLPLTQLDVISSTGRLLLTLEPSRGQQTLDLSYLPDGLYLIRLFADKRSVVQKLIIQH